MKFYARFAYYIFGFAIGIFFVSMMWSQKGVSCNYFPNARVLNDIRQKPFYYSTQADSTFAQGWIDKNDIKYVLTKGDVDFSKSNVSVKGGKLYVISGETTKNQAVVLEVVNGSDKALLRKIEKSK
ncbi:DUF4258 domain-containing protein [Flavobacterium sp. MAH-1]|uniref:DUF4258 domain-containing protein n=1 Tax=Flavobacterium agri TaxID=2743471 RepID=A0A7Y8XZP0_9FLAO|nr:DUF4258 domain-containing protein [Flavobacterium agri]NUY79869.1 DUF4258 domain-containing protein [Flavobacterium agri]NYA69894.1 DUF4258 domain-containing protein [Flavobacterium agri]